MPNDPARDFEQRVGCEDVYKRQMQRREQTWNAVERAEAILQASGAVIQHGGQNRAFYRLRTDSIHLPDKGQFPSADNYYACLLYTSRCV